MDVSKQLNPCLSDSLVQLSFEPNNPLLEPVTESHTRDFYPKSHSNAHT